MMSATFCEYEDGLALIKNAIDIKTQQKLINDIIIFGNLPNSGKGQMACIGSTNLNPNSTKRTNLLCNSLYTEQIHQMALKWIESIQNKYGKTFIPSWNDNAEIIARINHYPLIGGKINYHKDTIPGLDSKEHSKHLEPIVSLSLGNSAEFKYKNHWKDTEKKILLQSGDVLIFGGKSRYIIHSVQGLIANTCPKELDLKQYQGSRFNLTFREKVIYDRDKKEAEWVAKYEGKYNSRQLMAGLHLNDDEGGGQGTIQYEMNGTIQTVKGEYDNGWWRSWWLLPLCLLIVAYIVRM